MWEKFAISRNISKLLDSCEKKEKSRQFQEAFDSLVKIGEVALPALMEKNRQLIDEHAAYHERWRLRNYRASNDTERYLALESKVELHYRYALEKKQSCIVDVIQEIQHKG